MTNKNNLLSTLESTLTSAFGLTARNIFQKKNVY